MNVKCPKCRYRFEENISYYLKESTCVCPRCGTPFVYVLPKEYENNKSATTVDEKQINHFNFQSNVDDANTNRVQVKHNKSTINELNITYSDFHRKGLYNFNNYRKKNNRRIKEKTGFFLFTCGILLVLALLFVHLTSKHIYINEKLEFLDGDISEQMQSDNAVYYSFDFEDAEKAPEWIYGKWIAYTKYYSIILIIKNKTIKEINDSYAVSGIFKYKTGKIIAKYGEKNLFVYRLDMENKRIDCGEGIIMKKIN